VTARRLVSSAGLALCLAACATGGPRQAPPLSDEARRLVALLQHRRDEFPDLRTLAEITLRRGAGTERFMGVLLVKPPTSLRFEALSPFGQPILLMTLAGGTFSAYNVGDNHALAGPLNERTTGRWLGVPLDADAIVGLLTGRVVPGPDLRQAEVLPPDSQGPSFAVVGPHQRARFWMDLETGEVHRAQIGGGRTTITVTYTRSPGAAVPTELHATAGQDFEATIRYRDAETVAALDPERFVLQVPEGAQTQRFH
jgi:outer membrane lipoprotein-sorting protein